MTTATANRVLPAHRVGKRVQGAKTIQEALAAANLAGEVKVSETPVSSAILTPNGVSTLTIADKFITYRETAEGFILLGAISQENEHVAMGQFILKSATINKREIVQ